MPRPEKCRNCGERHNIIVLFQDGCEIKEWLCMNCLRNPLLVSAGKVADAILDKGTEQVADFTTDDACWLKGLGVKL